MKNKQLKEWVKEETFRVVDSPMLFDDSNEVSTFLESHSNKCQLASKVIICQLPNTCDNFIYPPSDKSTEINSKQTQNEE